MRIKIIGDNNCARATRHLLRMAGFAVTEFLPVEAITHAPHSGYAITIELAPASHPLNPLEENSEGNPASLPDLATHVRTPAVQGEASPSVSGGASSRLFDGGGVDTISGGGAAWVGFQKGRQAEACPTGILFDSVDGELELAVLRHVSRLAGGPVVVDRPGGVVRSERELRIVVPVTGAAKMDEAAAVAVEFGVLRGLLDLVAPRPATNVLGLGSNVSESANTKSSELLDTSDGLQKSAATQGNSGNSDRNKKKWWVLGALLVAHMISLFSSAAVASPHRAGLNSRVNVNLKTNLSSALSSALNSHLISSLTLASSATRSLLHFDASLLAAAPQGQSVTGQAVDPCRGEPKLYVSINQTANTQLVAGTASRKIYVCSIHVVVALATNVALVEGTGAVCATGTAGVGGFGGATAATGWNFAANSGIVLGSGEATVGAEVTSADNLCLFNSGSGQVSGGISYVVQ